MQQFDVNNPTIKERIIDKNSFAFAFINLMPIVPGHTLICPIRCVEFSKGLSDEEWKSILEMKQRVCQALTKAFNAEGFNFAWNEGKNAGQSVPHFHLHILPRKLGDAGICQYEPRQFLYRPGTRATSPAEELKQTADFVRKFIEPKKG